MEYASNERTFVRFGGTVYSTTFRKRLVAFNCSVALNDTPSNIKLSTISFKIKSVKVTQFIYITDIKLKPLKNFFLPKIIFLGAQTSSVSLLNPLITQW